MSRKILGLDIGCDSVAAVLVDSSLGENRIEGTGLVSIPDAGTWAEGLGTALTELDGRMSLAGAVCAASFPANQISFRNMRIPFRNAKKIGQVLPFELEPLLPFPADEVITDFLAVRPVPDQTDQTDIVALSIAKSDMKTCLDTLSGFRVDPGTVMPGPYPTAVCLNLSEKMPENWIMLDMQEIVATVFIVLSGRIHLMRCFPVHGGDERGKLLHTMIRQTLLAFEDMFFHPFEPEQMLVCGNIQDINILQELENLMEIPVAHSDILRNAGKRIRLSPGTEWRAGQLDNALALAITEIEGKNGLNFRKGMFAAHREWAVHKRNLITGAVFCALILFLVFANFMTDSLVMQKRIDRLDSRIAEIFRASFPDVQRIVNPLHQMQVALEDLRKSAPVPAGGVRNIRIADLLNEISQRIPKEIDTEFSRMVADPESILISGDTDTFNSVDSIQTSLEGSAFFRKVTISSTSKDQKGNRVNFKIKVDL
ncbi:MAG: type II secretion system protein GspL [Desulfococcaceae bacterium]